MQNTICVACKQPIDDALVVHTLHGPVHPGACLVHIETLPVTENTTNQLNETQLLID